MQSAEGMDTSLSVILVVAVMLRLPFKVATGLNLFYVLSSTVRYFVGFYNQSYFCRFACTISPPRLLSPLVTTPCAEGLSLDRLGRCIPVDSELHQLMAPLRTRQELLAVAAAHAIGSTPEEVLSQREPRCLCIWQLLSYIPWVLGLVSLMAFGCYRQEYNQRKRFLLDTQASLSTHAPPLRGLERAGYGWKVCSSRYRGAVRVGLQSSYVLYVDLVGQRYKRRGCGAERS